MRFGHDSSFAVGTLTVAGGRARLYVGDMSADRYAWAGDEPALQWGYCVSVVSGWAPAELLDAFEADPASMRLLTFAQQDQMAAPYPAGGGNDTIQIDALGTAAVCMQSNGWAWVEESRVLRISERGAIASAFCNVNGPRQLVYAREGRLVRDVDPLLYDAAGALPEEVGLPFGDAGAPDAASFALIERLTGVTLTPEWLLHTPHPCYRRAA